MSSSINREKFTQGVSLLFKTQWTALKLAVDMQWGGHDSEDKRDWLIGVIVDYFDKNGKNTDIDDLGTILNQVMIDEFNTLLEDDSAYQVSQDLIKIYNECIQGNYLTVDLLQSNQESTKQNSFLHSKKIKNHEEDEDGNSDDYDEILGQQNGENSTIENDEVIGINTSKSSKNEPIIDDDGFTLVTRKR
ncbi:Pre-rRNA-processing protein TSR2-domain-containing protein [Glomus cerebriforme]|uniref:Pre-rRNA-processing protein TSR2-domain-containing protein n=1 Tax=Glomus cerebriforme TaxID=658196 RepID=A0A397TJ40_9GLOM|nr:Pre-rRNA-processing protein TSR2-domain-containing protein [Glomus cerebriforme]